jgi:hypothetical protein
VFHGVGKQFVQRTITSFLLFYGTNTSIANVLLQIICLETEAVLQEPSFEEVELSTLMVVLEQDELRISSELELFKAAQRWAARECVRKGMSQCLLQSFEKDSELLTDKDYRNKIICFEIIMLYLTAFISEPLAQHSKMVFKLNEDCRTFLLSASLA